MCVQDGGLGAAQLAFDKVSPIVKIVYFVLNVCIDGLGQLVHELFVPMIPWVSRDGDDDPHGIDPNLDLTTDPKPTTYP